VNPIEKFLVIFPSIVFEALPFIVLGALISGSLEELLPQRLVTQIIPRRRSAAVAVSALLGLCFPMCECGIVPVMRRLLGKGLPLSCAVAYMLAAPIINPVVIASTWAAFSGDRSGLDNLTSFQMTFLRVAMAFVVAFVTGMVVHRSEKQHGVGALIRPIPRHHHHIHEHHVSEKLAQGHNPAPIPSGSPAAHPSNPSSPSHLQTLSLDPDNHEHLHLPVGHVHAIEEDLESKTWRQRLYNISETALHDFVDITCFLILGALLAACVQTFRLLDYAPFVASNAFLAAPAMMLLAILLCLCSEADAFVAANLLSIPLSGKIAFLVLGPMLDIKLFLMYTRVFRRRLIWTIIPTVVMLVLGFSLLTAIPYVAEILSRLVGRAPWISG